jgi:hypothetical protein
LQGRRTIVKLGGTTYKSPHPVAAEPLASLTEALANLVILSADAFYRGEGSALCFANARGKTKAGKANADSSPKKRLRMTGLLRRVR